MKKITIKNRKEFFDELPIAMNKIIVKNQEEFDKLPNEFRNYTEIQVRGNLDRIDRTFINAEISLYGSVRVESISNSAQIGNMYDSSRIEFMLDSTQVRYMFDLTQVGCMLSSAQVRNMSGSAQIGFMCSSSRIENMWSTSQVGHMHNFSQVEGMYDFSQIGVMFGSTQVRHMHDASQIDNMYDSSQVGVMYGSSQVGYTSMNCVIKIVSEDSKILKAAQNAVLIYQDCTGSPGIKDDSATISYTKRVEFSLDNFIRGYDVKTENNKLVLYKFVQNDYTDFHTGKIEYKIGTTVKCPDWNSNADRECGRGLHVSPSIEFCKRFNNSEDGHALKVLVDPKDIVVHPNPVCPYKIRCRQLTVVKEIK